MNNSIINSTTVGELADATSQKAVKMHLELVTFLRTDLGTYYLFKTNDSFRQLAFIKNLRVVYENFFNGNN